MNARPDVPDTPDRTDAIARIIDPACYGPTASPGTGRRSPTSRQIVARDIARVILATDDPAAVAAIADQWAEHHPETLLDALTKAGVLRVGGFSSDRGRVTSRLVTDWREVTE